MAFSVYILYSARADRYYVGHTSDVERRLLSHNSSDEIGGRYTRKNGPWRVVYVEDGFGTRSEAMRRERGIKGWKSRRRIEQLVGSVSDGMSVSLG